jgi:hypothetical protein
MNKAKLHLLESATAHSIAKKRIRKGEKGKRREFGGRERKKSSLVS